MMTLHLQKAEWWCQLREGGDDHGKETIGFHWDKDEELLDEAGLNVFPQLSTVRRARPPPKGKKKKKKHVFLLHRVLLVIKSYTSGDIYIYIYARVCSANPAAHCLCWYRGWLSTSCGNVA